MYVMMGLKLALQFKRLTVGIIDYLSTLSIFIMSITLI